MMKIKIRSGAIVVNGHIFHGKDFTIRNGIVSVDGIGHCIAESSVINVVVNGDIETLTSEKGTVDASDTDALTSIIVILQTIY